jgi:hypothetical protein
MAGIGNRVKVALPSRAEYRPLEQGSAGATIETGLGGRVPLDNHSLITLTLGLGAGLQS